VGYTKPAEQIGNHYDIELNTVTDPKRFAAQIGGNVLVRAKPISI